MANRFWVGGTATWDATAGSKWATTSGGVGGSAVPTAADDVFLDSASGVVVVTMSASSVARSIDCNGFTGTLQHPGSLTVPIGDGTAGAGNRALRFVSGMTYTKANASSSAFSFISTSATQQTIDSGGKTMGNITLAGVGSSYVLAAALTLDDSATFTHTNGTFGTGNFAWQFGIYSSSNSNTRALNLGSSTVTPRSTACWDITTSTNMTLNAGTSTLTFSNSATTPTFQGGGLTYYNWVSTNGAGGFTINGANTFNSMTLTITGGVRRYQLGANQTVNGVFTITGQNASPNRASLNSNVRGTTRTITLGASSSVAFTNVDFEDITFTGTGVPVSGTSLGDLGGNTGITFTTPVTRYWIGNGGNFSDTAHWSTSSGGSGGASAPLAQDDWNVDANSFTLAGQTLILDCYRTGKNISFVGLSQAITVQNGNQSSNGVGFHGSLTLTSNVTLSLSGTGTVPNWNFYGRGTHTITTAGASFPASSSGVLFLCPGGTYTLQDNLTSLGSVQISNGTFNSNNKNITCDSFNSSAATTRTVTLGTSTITLTGVGTVWNLGTTTSLTFSGASSTIVISDTSASSKTFSSGSGAATYGTVTIPAGGAGAVIFNSNNKTFTTLNVTGAKTINFAPSTTYTFTTLNLTGTSGNVITVASSTPGSKYTLSVASGLVQMSYVTISDAIATGGATFLDFTGIDGGGNTGINFSTVRTVATSRAAALLRASSTARIAVSRRYKN